MDMNSMQLIRVVLLGGMAFLGAVALFLGGVVMLTSWQSGTITLSYTAAGNGVTETVTRTVDAGRFWRMYGTLGIAPAVLGAATMLICVRALRRRRQD